MYNKGLGLFANVTQHYRRVGGVAKWHDCRDYSIGSEYKFQLGIKSNTSRFFEVLNEDGKVAEKSVRKARQS
jgi:hypothetical protein